MTDADDRSERIPADLDAEGVVLSALLMGGMVKHYKALNELGLVGRHFYSEANGVIYEACVLLDEACDAVSVAGKLRETGQLHRCGGTPYLATLADTQPATAHPEVHALTIIELWRRRKFLDVTARLGIQMRHGEVDARGAYLALREFYQENRP